MDNGLVSALTHWLFGLPPDQVRWVHVCLALVMSSMVWGPPLARLYWHVRRERFLLRATPDQLRAYMQDPPKPPSIGGPAAMVLALLLAGTLIRGGPSLPVESASVVPSAPAQTQSTDPQTHTSTDPQDPRGMACFPPRESQDEGEESKTCCKGRCEPGSRCNTRTCECEARAVAPSGAMRFIDVGASIFPLEAGSTLDSTPTDWEPSAHDWSD
jgi:hypothetical protein